MELCGTYASNLPLSPFPAALRRASQTNDGLQGGIVGIHYRGQSTAEGHSARPISFSSPSSSSPPLASMLCVLSRAALEPEKSHKLRGTSGEWSICRVGMGTEAGDARPDRDGALDAHLVLAVTGPSGRASNHRGARDHGGPPRKLQLCQTSPSKPIPGSVLTEALQC